MPDIPFPHFLQLDEPTLWTLGVVSLVMFIGTLVAVPWLIVRIPADYFATSQREVVILDDRHPLVRLTLLILKNLLGAVFIVLGVGMLVLPGQGLLTIFIGVVLLNFPGKYRLERWLVLRRPIRRTVNWLRRHYGYAPLEFDQDDSHAR